jgi:hypothetical protein
MIYYKNGVAVNSIQWAPPTTRTDGSAYGADDHAGYELGVGNDGIYEPWVSVPASYDITEWPVDQLNMNDEGDYQIVLRTVDTGGRVSEWSAPVNFTVTLADPNPPTGLDVF